MKRVLTEKLLLLVKKTAIVGAGKACNLRSPADSDAFQNGRCALHNGRPETHRSITLSAVSLQYNA